MDLTGGLAERWSLKHCGSDEKQREQQDNDHVRKRWLDLRLLHSVRNHCALSCSTNDNPEGPKSPKTLVFSFFPFVLISHLMNCVTITGACEPDQYHALSVMEWLDVDKVAGDKVHLLRIRNPWGRDCWGGVWTKRLAHIYFHSLTKHVLNVAKILELYYAAISYLKANIHSDSSAVDSLWLPADLHCCHSEIRKLIFFLCSGDGWSSIDPSYALELQSRAAEGEFWLDECEFLSQFNDITVGYPITDEGHLRSIYSGQWVKHG